MDALAVYFFLFSYLFDASMSISRRELCTKFYPIGSLGLRFPCYVVALELLLVEIFPLSGGYTSGPAGFKFLLVFEPLRWLLKTSFQLLDSLV